MEQLYDTEFLLERLFDKLESNKSQRFMAVKPISIKQNRKTHITNFDAFCKSIKRDPNTVKTYIEEQLAKDSSITLNGTLIINRIYHQHEIDKVFVSYIKTFVLCAESKCGSGNTEFIKENRITYLVCKVCNSKKAL